MEWLNPLLVPLRLLAMFGGADLVRHWADEKRLKSEKAARQQTEIDRKLAIAEAAQAARARGERFVPPADYDR